MQTAMHPAFEQKLAVLAALLERSKSVRAEALAKVAHSAPRFQASSKGRTWHVVEISTGAVRGLALSYHSALRLADTLEAAVDGKILGDLLMKLMLSDKRDARISPRGVRLTP